jgi:putative oxidoreductase
VLLLLGLATRFSALSLLVITGVATAAVHWPVAYDSVGQLWEGYAITAKDAGNFKLPLLFELMLLPLLFYGGGKLSLDHLLINLTGRNDRLDDRIRDIQGAGLALLALGLTLVWVEPVWGGALLGAGALALIAPQFGGNPLRS